MVITTYDDHVRLLSSGPWLVGSTKSTRAWEPTLSWNFMESLHSRSGLGFRFSGIGGNHYDRPFRPSQTVTELRSLVPVAPICGSGM